MAYRVITVILLGLLSIQAPQLYAAAALSADVGKLLTDAREKERIPVIVRFKKAHEISKLASIYNNQHQHQDSSKSQTFKKKQYRRGVFNGLKQQAKQSAASVAGLLRKHAVKTQLKSLWAINAIAFDAPAELIEEIATLPNVARISVDMRLTISTPQVEEISSEPLWNINRLNTSRLWQQGITGEGVVVAIMDSGVDLNHPDLSSQWRGESNSWFDPYGEHDFPTDQIGHGTQALGLILGGNESGYQVGLAPEAQWIAAKIFDDTNQSTLSAIHQAFQWVLDPDGDPLTDDAPDLVNNSWGFATTINECYQEFDEDIRLLRELGIGVVFAAGNYGPSSESSISPANNPGSLSVGSIDQIDEIDLLSSRGPGACDGGVFPKLVAPGGQVFTTDLLPIAYNVVSGTSFAAPHVSGAMALLKSAFPGASLSQIETALYDSAVDLGEAGSDDQFGYGLVDISAAYDLLYVSFGSSDKSLLQFNESRYSVDEATQRLIVTVRRLGGSEGVVSVDYATSDGTAHSANDYKKRLGRVTFADGETLRNFEIPIINDRADEENETFYLTLSDIRGEASLGHQNEVEVMILDDDGAGTITFSAVSYAVNESRQEAIVNLVRTGGSAGIVDVEYQFVADTASAESDFIGDDGKIRFANGETKKQLTIDLIDDSLFEGSERFQLMITELDGKADIGEPASATVTILDDDLDDRVASIHLGAVNYDIKENSGSLTLEVTRAGNSEDTVSVEYTTLDGSAKQEKDYRSASGSLIFPAGTTRRSLTLNIINDTLFERESSFSLRLFDAGGGAVISAPSTAIIRIIDDDALPFVSINSAPRRSSVGQVNLGFSSDKEMGQQRQGANRGTSSTELKIFDLSLRGISPAVRQAIDALKTLDASQEADDKADIETTDQSDASLCAAGNRSDGVVSTEKCVSEESNLLNRQSDIEKTSTENSVAEDKSETPVAQGNTVLEFEN